MMPLETRVSVTQTTQSADNFTAFNYCLSFIDLLGQREAVRGQGLLPALKSEAEERAFRAVIRDSVGAIIRLQRDAEAMMPGITEGLPDSPFRAQLSKEDQAIWDQMQFTRLTTQRWSDGLVSFVCLGDQQVKCPMNGVFGVFALGGSLCFLGLATQRPIRGAIDVAWGVELHAGELYGPAVAGAYELESEIAQYPRIVVGARAVGLLQAYSANAEQDHFSRFNHDLAELCLNLLVQDADGYWILHYLGDTFQRAVTQKQHRFLYEKALAFVLQQMQQHQGSGNSKLAFRYSHLLEYFEAHPTLTPGGEEAQLSVAADQPQAAGG